MSIRPINLKNATDEIGLLREKVLKIFVDNLIQKEGDNLLKIILFGSVARGNAEPDSDLDVCVIVKTGENLELANRIIDISYEIDIDEGTHISPFARAQSAYEEGLKAGIPIYQNIEREGVILYDVEG